MSPVTLEAPPARPELSPRAADEHIPGGYDIGVSGYTMGCRCPGCVEGRRAYNREWMRAKREGNPRTMAAREARKHISFLQKKVGLTLPEIARRAGCSLSTVQGIANGKRTSIKRDTADSIMGVEAAVTVAPFVSVVHVIPLLEAMHDTGLSWMKIANALGHKDPNWVWGVRHQRKYVTGRSFRKIVTLYSLLAREGQVPNDPLAKLLEVMKV